MVLWGQAAALSQPSRGRLAALARQLGIGDRLTLHAAAAATADNATVRVNTAGRSRWCSWNAVSPPQLRVTSSSRTPCAGRLRSDALWRWAQLLALLSAAGRPVHRAVPSSPCLAGLTFNGGAFPSTHVRLTQVGRRPRGAGGDAAGARWRWRPPARGPVCFLTPLLSPYRCKFGVMEWV